MTGLCTNDALADFKIDALRGGIKQQAALVTITIVAEITLYFKHVQLDAAEDVVAKMSRMLAWATWLNQQAAR